MLFVVWGPSVTSRTIDRALTQVGLQTQVHPAAAAAGSAAAAAGSAAAAVAAF